MEPTTIRHIVRTADICGGKPRVDGTRIRVWDIYVWHEMRGMTPAEIVTSFPQLSLADVHAALAYFWDHQEEVRADLDKSEDLVSQLRAMQGLGVLDRIRSSDGRADSVSP